MNSMYGILAARFDLLTVSVETLASRCSSRPTLWVYEISGEQKEVGH